MNRQKQCIIAVNVKQHFRFKGDFIVKFPTIISYCNYGYSDFAEIMLFNLNNTIKSHKIHFYCLDQEMFDELTSWVHQLTNITITFELVNISNISKNFEQYGSQSYNAITK